MPVLGENVFSGLHNNDERLQLHQGGSFFVRFRQAMVKELARRENEVP